MNILQAIDEIAPVLQYRSDDKERDYALHNLDLMRNEAIALQAQLDALQQENARLLEKITAIETVIDTDFKWGPTLEMRILQLLEDEISIKKLCREALQPVEDKS